MYYYSVKNKVEIILKNRFFEVVFGWMIPEFSDGHFEKSGIFTQTHRITTQKSRILSNPVVRISDFSVNVIFLELFLYWIWQEWSNYFQRIWSLNYELYLRRVKRSRYMEVATFALISPKSFRRTCAELNIIRSVNHIKQNFVISEWLNREKIKVTYDVT